MLLIALGSSKIGVLFHLLGPRLRSFNLSMVSKLHANTWAECGTSRLCEASAGRSVVASAPALGAGDREFESPRPDHKFHRQYPCTMISTSINYLEFL